MEKYWKLKDNKLFPGDENDFLYYLIDKDEYENMLNALENFKRINREKKNSENGLYPKRERSGYQLLSYDTSNLTLKLKDEENNKYTNKTFSLRRLLIETTYDLSFSYLDVEKMICDDNETLKFVLQGEDFINKNKIKTLKQSEFMTTSNSKKTIIYSTLEAQARDNLWAVRLFCNYTPLIDEDLLNNKDDKK